MAKVKTITKRLKNTDDYYYIPEEKGVNTSYKIYASPNGNEIHDASGNDYLYGGNGADFLIASAGNDTLSGGKGDNLLGIHGADSGKDTILLGKGTDHLIFGVSDTFAYSKSGNNLIITHSSGAHENGQVIVKDYFKYADGKASLKDMGNSADALVSIKECVNEHGLTLLNVTKKNAKITGTYLNDIITAQGNVKNTITTDAGDDEVTAGLGADTVTINATGTKTIYINKGDSNDVIAFSGQGVNAETVLAFDTNQDSIDFADYSFAKSGNNLLIKRSWMEDGKTTTETTTIKDYFKYNDLDIKVKRYDADDSDTSLSDLIDTVSIVGNTKKANTLAGSNFDDTITGGAKADKITTGYGEDEITAGKGNDTITINGAGDKIINIGRNDGNDTIAFNLNNVEVEDKINVEIVFDDVYGEAPETSYSIASNNLDLIITNKYPKTIVKNEDTGKTTTYKALTQTITVKNYFGNYDKVNLIVDGNDEIYETLEDAKSDVLGTKGTPFDDEIHGTNKADTIYGYAGNDTIISSKGNDKIYGGDGNDSYVYENFTERWDDNKYYTDTIYNSNGNDTISFTDLASSSPVFQTQPKLQAGGNYPSFRNRYGYTYIKQGNDLVIGAFESEDIRNRNYPMNRIVLKDYFKSAKGEFGVKYVDNGKGNDDYAQINLADDMVIEHSYRTISALSDTKSNNYTGTAYNDYIEGSYKQDVLKGGDGNDYIYGITSTKGKDKLYGGAGNDLLSDDNAYMYGGTGNDTYASYMQDTTGSWSNVIYDEAGYDTLALVMGTYLTYFDVTQKNGEVVSTGDMYVKDTTLRLEPNRLYHYRYTDDRPIEERDFWDENPDLTDDDVEKVMYYNGSKLYHEYKDEGTKRYEVAAEDAKYIAQNRTLYGYKYISGTYNGIVFYDADADLASKRGDIVQYTDETYYSWFTEEDRATYTVYEEGTVKENMLFYGYKKSDGTVFYSANPNLRSDTVEQLLVENNGKYEWKTQNIGTRIVNASDHTDYHDVYGYIYNDKVFYSTDANLNYDHYNTQRVYTYSDMTSSSFIEAKGIISRLKMNDFGYTIQGGTTKENVIENYTIGFHSEFYNDGYAASYDQEAIDTTAELVAAKLKEYGFSSVQDAIKKGSNEQLGELINIFKNNMMSWTDVDYNPKNFVSEGGTAYFNDDTGNNTNYTLSFTSDDRYSIINDYAGTDRLFLDDGDYSLLFDVEVDNNGNLLNYSRDFYIKFAGEEGDETGVVIHDGRQQMHAVEQIYADYDLIFEYNQETVDAVRQNVAGWLTDKGFGSVQEVLYEHQDDIAEMMAYFDELKDPID